MAASSRKSVPETDFAVFDPATIKLTTVHGEPVTVPPITFRKERKISKLLSGLLGHVIDSGIFATDDLPLGPDGQPDLVAITRRNNGIMTHFAKLLLDVGVDQMAEATAILLNKDEDRDWVEDNLTSEAMLDLLIPFLASKRDSIRSVLERQAGHLALLAQAAGAAA